MQGEQWESESSKGDCSASRRLDTARRDTQQRFKEGCPLPCAIKLSSTFDVAGGSQKIFKGNKELEWSSVAVRPCCALMMMVVQVEEIDEVACACQGFVWRSLFAQSGISSRYGCG